MPAPKIPETPDFVKGLVKSADQIYMSLPQGNGSGRYLLQRLKSGEVRLEELSGSQRQLLGMYQARVVLMVLAAELALKFLWQQTNPEPAGDGHNLDKLFNGLKKCLQIKIEVKYSERCKAHQPAAPPPEGWETPKQAFELCKDASIRWRYLVEEKKFPDYAMQATYLKYATLSVLQVAEILPKKD